MNRTGLAKKAAVAVAVVVVAGAAVAAAIGIGGTDGGTAAADELPPATAQVTRQTLVDSETATGELGYGAETTLRAKLPGTVTWLPSSGATIKRGKALYRVDNEPVVLLYGTLPAYRELRAGLSGADVKQLERNLSALGYGGFTVDGDYTTATADAVRQWQDDLGLAETGRVHPAQVAYAAGVVRVDTRVATVGDGVQPGAGVLIVTGTARVVTVRLDVDDQRLAKKGAAVRLTVPDGDRITGKITDVATVIETSSGGGTGTGTGGGDTGPSTKIEVTVSVDKPAALSGYDQASVDVDFTASERKDVLTVPVAALLALAEGGYGVEVVSGTATRVVAVQTGLFADGRVEITGSGVDQGTTVGMPS